MIQRAL